MIDLKNIVEYIGTMPDCIETMKKIHFCADLHYGHSKIINICNRPVYLMDQELWDIPLVQRNINNKWYKERIDKAHEDWLVKDVWNKWIKKKDTVYILGDLSFANKVNTEKFVNRLNGEKFMILGNHDKSSAGLPQFTQITQIKDFTFSQFGLNIHIVLAHYPLASWNRKPHGAWHLYGHVHGRYKLPGLAFDVGIDNSEIHQFPGGGWRPINLYEVCQIMQDKARNTGDEKIAVDYGIIEGD
jgi:calcineurin-like phosphoesterase family protein